MEYSIGEAKRSIKRILIPGTRQPVSIFIWGPPGIGKSEMVAQLASEFGPEYMLIDMRLSQYDSVDLKGLPREGESKTMHWLVPEDLPTEDNPLFKGTKGILFLDEFNRARFEVQQSGFQLVLDRCVGGHRILDSWFIIAAGNFGYEDDTDVGEMDSALLNRFAHFEIKCEPAEWITWAKQNKVHEDIVGFIQTHPDKLYNRLTSKKDDPVALVTPRSWVKFSSILLQNPDTPAKIVNQELGPSLLRGFSSYFGQYLDDKNIVSAEDIIFHYSKVKAKLKTFQRDQIQAINQEITSFIVKKSNGWDATQRTAAMGNFNKYLDDNLEADLIVAFCRQTWKACKEVNSTFMREFLNEHSDKTDLNISLLDDSKSRRR